MPIRNKDVQAALAIAADAFNENPAIGLLVRHFGASNARMLLRDCRATVSRMHASHSAVLAAIEAWDGSPKSASTLARAALAYNERLHELELLTQLLGKAPLQTPHHTGRRRRERATFHRQRQASQT